VTCDHKNPRFCRDRAVVAFAAEPKEYILRQVFGGLKVVHAREDVAKEALAMPGHETLQAGNVSRGRKEVMRDPADRQLRAARRCPADRNPSLSVPRYVACDGYTLGPPGKIYSPGLFFEKAPLKNGWARLFKVSKSSSPVVAYHIRRHDESSCLHPNQHLQSFPASHAGGQYNPEAH